MTMADDENSPLNRVCFRRTLPDMKWMKKLFGMQVDPKLLPDTAKPPTNPAFPVEKLIVAAPGRLSCSAHKWHHPLHLDWEFVIGFQPVEFVGETCDTAICIEIETTDISRLDQFTGMQRHEADPIGTFGSFYLFDCRTSVDTRFRIHSVQGNKLNIEASILVDIGDSYVDSNPPLRIIKARSEVVFEGILVSSRSVECKPEEEALMKVANELFDTSLFASPKMEWDSYESKQVLNFFFKPLS
ncbi:MAG: hypothetical protein QOD03_1746 [Verrucomicrobiota bacterium]|jgi:hypothetical protein